MGEAGFVWFPGRGIEAVLLVGKASSGFAFRLCMT